MKKVPSFHGNKTELAVQFYNAGQDYLPYINCNVEQKGQGPKGPGGKRAWGKKARGKRGGGKRAEGKRAWGKRAAGTKGLKTIRGNFGVKDGRRRIHGSKTIFQSLISQNV